MIVFFKYPLLFKAFKLIYGINLIVTNGDPTDLEATSIIAENLISMTKDVLNDKGDTSDQYFDFCCGFMQTIGNTVSNPHGYSHVKDFHLSNSPFAFDNSLNNVIIDEIYNNVKAAHESCRGVTAVSLDLHNSIVSDKNQQIETLIQENTNLAFSNKILLATVVILPVLSFVAYKYYNG